MQCCFGNCPPKQHNPRSCLHCCCRCLCCWSCVGCVVGRCFRRAPNHHESWNPVCKIVFFHPGVFRTGLWSSKSVTNRERSRVQHLAVLCCVRIVALMSSPVRHDLNVISAVVWQTASLEELPDDPLIRSCAEAPAEGAGTAAGISLTSLS